MGTFDNGQLRGAFSAGYESGVKAGIERMRHEGWRRWQPGHRTPVIGEIVKTVVPTISGWIGLGKVLHVDGIGVVVGQLDLLCGDPDEDGNKKADLCMHEIAIKWVKNATDS